MRADPEPSEHELKFVLDGRLEAAVAARLDGLFEPDPEFPDNVVASLYFDGLGLSSLADKRDGQLVKSKFRLRWYESAFGTACPGFGHFEIKHRFGTRRRKWRADSSCSGVVLAALPRSLVVGGGELRPEMRRLEATGVPCGGLEPALVVRYRRRRYVDRASRTRLSFDTEIHPSSIRCGHSVALLHRRAGHAVVEVKNASGEVPPALRSMLGRLVLGTSYSKYERCFAVAAGCA